MQSSRLSIEWFIFGIDVLDGIYRWSHTIIIKLKVNFIIDKSHMESTNIHKPTMIFGLFSRKRRFTDREQRINYINDVIGYAMDSSINKMVACIEKNEIDINSDECVDVHNQTLLHIAVLKRNKCLVQQLLDMGIHTQVKNVFGELPIDIAIKNHDVEIVKMLLDHDLTYDYNYYMGQYDIIVERNKLLEDDVVKLQECNKEMTKENEQLTVAIESEKTGSKRVREDNEHLENVNNILVEENGKLNADNEVLGATVETMRKRARNE